MAKPDKMPNGGKFRAVADASIDGTAGAFGDGDLLGVTVGAAGTLLVSDGTNLDGVIYTPEGKRDSSLAGYKDVVGGKTYTVLRFGEIVEMSGSTPAVSAGDKLYGAAAGSAGPSAVGAVFLGWVDNTGERLIVDVGGKAEG